jgi:hypothetical protein
VSLYRELVAGKLGIEDPSNTHLICSNVMHHTNHFNFARFVNDALKVLLPTSGVHDEKVLILYSDAAAFVLKAANALKVFYPNLIHFTCLTHGLQRAAEEVKSSPPK